MGLRCYFGHKGTDATFNRGLYFGHCARCGRPTIRRVGGHWYGIPKNFVVRWKSEGTHALSPRELLYRARKQAPLAHKLRRTRSRWAAYYD